MSKSIRYLTDAGFLKLVSDIQKEFKFLNTIRITYNYIYLGIDDFNVVFANKATKTITPCILGYKVMYIKGRRMMQLFNEGFESEPLTRKTLFKRLALMQQIADEYHEALE